MNDAALQQPATTIVQRACFWDEAAAHAWLEQMVWPQGPVCPHCGATDRIGNVTGKGARRGLKYCCHCCRQFRATMGTMFEHAHMPLHKWFQACFLLTATRQAISVQALSKELGITYRSARKLVRCLDSVLRALAFPPLICLQTHVRRSKAIPGGQIFNSAMREEPLPDGAGRQYRRFLAAVRDLGCDVDDRAFEAVLTRIARYRPPRQKREHIQRAAQSRTDAQVTVSIATTTISATSPS